MTKVELWEGYRVYLTKRQLDQAVDQSSNWTHLIHNLLNVFFTPCILSCLGTSNQHSITRLLQHFSVNEWTVTKQWQLFKMFNIVYLQGSLKTSILVCQEVPLLMQWMTSVPISDKSFQRYWMQLFVQLYIYLTNELFCKPLCWSPRKKKKLNNQYRHLVCMYIL